MVIIQRRLFGVIRYRKAFFPTLEQANELINGLQLNDIVRFVYPVANAFDSSYCAHVSQVATVCIDLRQDLDTIFKRMEARSCRQRIRKAEKCLERIRIVGKSENAIVQFLDMYNDFARAKGTVPPVSREHLDLYLRVSDLTLLYLDDRPMCGHVTLRDEELKHVVLMFSGSRRFEGKEDASMCSALGRFLHWYELQRYREQGMAVYDFGGIGHENLRANFNQFKLSFGGDIVSEYRYTFSGARSLARLGVDAYIRLRNSKASRLLPHV